ncbi:MAG: hypothetical protein JRJ87_10045 [Deltaproteobacteria bacterium]|nr:hypothetical protein [Deltaproteobacteria bacterium]
MFSWYCDFGRDRGPFDKNRQPVETYELKVESVRREPSADGFKKIEYLRFIGANNCPACGEEVAAEAYVCVRDDEGQIVEKYRCSICGVDYAFPTDVVH